MKILTVDDNEAIRDNIKVILENEGHNICSEGTVTDGIKAVLSFKPDIVIIDTLVDGEDGLQVLSGALKADPSLDIRAVLVKSPQDETPKDSPHIRSVIIKPFRSEAVVKAVAEAAAGTIIQPTPTEKPNKLRVAGALNRLRAGSGKILVREEVQNEEEVPSKRPISESYVLFEEDPGDLYALLAKYHDGQHTFLVVSSDNPKVVKDRCGFEDVSVMTLSSNKKGGSMDITALGTLMAAIGDFVQWHAKPVVAFDDLANIIDSNGMNRSLMFIHQLIRKSADGTEASFAVSVDPSILTMKDRDILLGDLTELKA